MLQTIESQEVWEETPEKTAEGIERVKSMFRNIQAVLTLEYGRRPGFYIMARRVSDGGTRVELGSCTAYPALDEIQSFLRGYHAGKAAK